MVLDIAVVILGILLVLAILLVSSRNRNSGAPPGPWGFPILGHLPLMGDNPGKKLTEWKKTYGNIVSVRFGSLDTVVFNDAKTAKEAFNTYELNGRKDISYFPEATQRKGMGFGDGPLCYEQRRFVIKGLNDFGLHNKDLKRETTIHTEILKLLNSFKLKNGGPIKIHHAFITSTVNAIFVCLSGTTFELGDPKLEQLATVINKILTVPTGWKRLPYFIPWLWKLMPNLSGYNKGLRDFKDLIKFMENHGSEVEKSRIRNQPRNFADAYMDKVDETTDESSSFFHSRKFQAFTFSDLLLGGLDTTSTLLEWTLAYLAVYQEVQKKLQMEIFEATGNTRLPCLADRPSMPYAEAMVYEVMRCVPLVPLTVGKEAMETTIFHGYTIPKGTQLYANFYGIAKDPDVWGDPENFRPERFMDENGKFIRREEFLPFGWGKRICPGEYLARDQYLLYVTSLFQKFHVTCVPGKEINLNGEFGFIMHMDESNEVIMTERM